MHTSDNSWEQLEFSTYLFAFKKKNKTQYWEDSLVPDHRSGMAVDSGPSCAESCCVTLGVRLHIPESQSSIKLR